MCEPIENKTELKSFKDVKCLADLDLTQIELIKGKTPPDIKERCLQLCKDYLTGNWWQQTEDTIEVRRVTGGLVNQLYYCGIKHPDNTVEVPQEVAIRLYYEHCLGSIEKSRIRDEVIALLFSENNIGPKAYGLFEEGQILKYYQHRQLNKELQKNLKIMEKVFKTLAKIHSLDVPLKKNPNWMSELILNYYSEAYKKFPIIEEMNEFKCDLLKNFDIKAEIDWIIGVAESIGSPVVFTHNDFRSGNLLFTEFNDELVVCDFDLSGYGYRGHDFVPFSREMGGGNHIDKNAVIGIPFKDEELKSLIGIYVEECERIYGKSYSQNPINSVDHILKEVKIFLLFSSLFGTVYRINCDAFEDGFPPRRLCMEMAEKSIERYIAIKNELKQQNIIK